MQLWILSFLSFFVTFSWGLMGQYFHVAFAADDMPVVVVTHGDLLSVYDRARVRVHLGEHLGISPEKQIFDIPDGLIKKLNSCFFCEICFILTNMIN